MRHVAEVHDAGDQAVVACQDIVRGQVAMDDLGAQQPPARRDGGIEPVQHGSDCGAGSRVLDGPGHRPGAGRMLDVPGEPPDGPRVDKSAQRDAQLSRSLAPGGQGLVRQGERIQPRMARQHVIGPHPIARAVVLPAHSECGRVAGRSRRNAAGVRPPARLSDRQARITSRGMQRRQRLHVKHSRVLGRIGNLEHRRACP